MKSFDASDFTKSALALALGMGAVCVLMAVRSPADSMALGLTAGLPLGVLSLWGVYSLKNRGQQKSIDRFFADEPAKKSLFGLGDNPLAAPPLPRSVERRTLVPESRLRERALVGRPVIPETETKDQWHQN